MRYWWRELAGWALVVLGLLMFAFCAVLLVFYQKILESGPLTLAGIFVFRGGIHLLKVAVAARVCTEAAAEFGKRPGPN